jgi:5-hydroxyisourate hydrolase/2-oxo-4-hydroxy-4-carboxy-5-ureidoimidazoline decarboxylase
MTLHEFNQAQRQEAIDVISTCCGSARWASSMVDARPFNSVAAITRAATEVWYEQCGPADWREAFSHHPRIGEIAGLQEKFASTSHLAGAEQAGVHDASTEVLQAIARGNTEYDERNGFLFIVCATGRTAPHMLRLLEDRLQNSAEEELAIAMGEQQKITMIRLQKLYAEEDWSSLPRSQLTTHVLDTSAGRPGAGITVRLLDNRAGHWQTVAQGITDADGRVPDLLPPGRILPPATYTISFDTGRYYEEKGARSFYPAVEIRFTVFDATHYHVPLLLNPFGYSTYRGT